ncbi:tRNA pseudouridine(13) synthase TruD [Caldicellulosiruptoraceae bacterium PP1]
MKLKVLPEDFIVKEIINLNLKKNGKYKIYKLTKKHWNTMDAIKWIAKESNIPIDKIGNGGRKDRHALTEQYISCPKEYDLKFSSSDNVKLEFLGFYDDFVSPAIVAGNHFEITIRKIKDEKEKILKRIEHIKNFGYPNYFDDQRFGSVENDEEFIGEKIVKKHYNGALKLYFTVIHPEDKKEEKERKRKIFEVWGNFEEVYKLCKTKTEKEIIKTLMKGKSRHFLIEAINKIPKDELSMFFSAYQSYLWNKTLSYILESMGIDLSIVKGKIMDYYIYKEIKQKQFKILKDIKIPTVSHKIPFVNEAVNSAVEDILVSREVKVGDFNIKNIRKSFYKSFLRDAIVTPKNLLYGDFEEDDFYNGFYKFKLSFDLPPGSFATMFFKAITIL